MSTYKVKLGEEIVAVDGLAGLVKLVQEGRLAPEDPVFIPSTNRWHYARSVRQLREYFPGTPEPPKEPAKEPAKDSPRGAAPSPPARGNGSREASPPQPTSGPPREESRGADVLRLRTGRWSPEGRIEVPVFSYEVDADPPPGFQWVRLGLVTGSALIVGFFVWVYLSAYAEHIRQFETTGGDEFLAPATHDGATPLPASVAGTSKSGKKNAPRATPAQTKLAGVATPVSSAAPSPASATQTPAPATAFDEKSALAKVRSTSVTSVKRPADLGPAIARDLTRIAVPVRSIAFVPKKGVSGTAVPFVCVVEYVRGEKIEEATAKKHRYMTVAMIGRRVTELNLRLDSIRFIAIRGKARSESVISADLARRIADGSASAADLR